MKTYVQELTNPNVTLTAYLHSQSEELSNAQTRPAVLVFPGGGYMMCSDREAEPIALAYMAEGYNAFVLRYSVGYDCDFKLALKDAEEALSLLETKSTEWNLQTDKIAVVGFSAGGHLAASLGTMGKLRPSALILGYPCILSEMGQMLRKKLPGVHELVDSKTPPTFIFTTQNDLVVNAENSLQFALALQRIKVPYELHVYSDGAHGLSLAKPHTSNGSVSMVNKPVSEWFPLSISWLKALWGDYEVASANLQPGLTSNAVLQPISKLLERPELAEVLVRYIPEALAALEEKPEGSYVTLIMLAEHTDMLNADDLHALDAELKEYEKKQS